MFNALNPVVFTLDIEGFPRELQVLEFRAREALNQPYEVKLELVGERQDLDLELLHHRPLSCALALTVALPTESGRRVYPGG